MHRQERIAHAAAQFGQPGIDRMPQALEHDPPGEGIPIGVKAGGGVPHQHITGNNAVAMQQANQRGGEEALMCNYRGELSECSQSNFFMVRNGVLLTPRSEAGLLEGITRGFLFDVAREAGIGAREETLYPADLETADEIFITSTTRELSPVVRVDDRIIGTGAPGPITLDLLTRYRRYAWESTANVVAAEGRA